MISDSDFTAAADATLQAIGLALDAAVETGAGDVDWSQNDGVLEIECADGSRIIVNRHVANRELWVAAKSGGFHFRPSEGRWLDTRSGEELAPLLARALKAQAGATVTLPLLPAPAV